MEIIQDNKGPHKYRNTAQHVELYVQEFPQARACGASLCERRSPGLSHNSDGWAVCGGRYYLLCERVCVTRAWRRGAEGGGRLHLLRVQRAQPSSENSWMH